MEINKQVRDMVSMRDEWVAEIQKSISDVLLQETKRRTSNALDRSVFCHSAIIASIMACSGPLLVTIKTMTGKDNDKAQEITQEVIKELLTVVQKKYMEISNEL